MSGELHHSLAGVTMLLAVSVLSFSLGVCVGVAIMLLGEGLVLSPEWPVFWSGLFWCCSQNSPFLFS